ncbi:MAG: hypothetical protein COA42_19560 [Alteromonadaceae bacterium]|nr:MAG: hypothetical protein COA42_19560 [Alteromonadaceae bacterium]
MQRVNKQVVWSAGVLGASFILVMLMYSRAPTVELKSVSPELPYAKYVQLSPQRVRLDVETRGRVEAERLVHWVSEVNGVIHELSPNFSKGGFFAKGDVLAKIDDERYRLAAMEAEAHYLVAEQSLRLELGEAKYAQQQAQAALDVSGDSLSVDQELVLRKPQLIQAQARVKVARAKLLEAQLNLKNTVLRALVNGRVLGVDVGVGQFVRSGDQLGSFYTTDLALVRLPLRDTDLKSLDLNILSNTSERLSSGVSDRLSVPPLDSPAGINVMFYASVAGREFQWPGTIRRTEATVDRKTGLYYAIAEVANPYGLNREEGGQEGLPLTVGMFVEARIEGRYLDNIFVVPADWIDGNKVRLLDANDRLISQKVSVLKRDKGQVFVGAGLTKNDRIVVEYSSGAVNGTQVEALAYKEIISQTLSTRFGD